MKKILSILCLALALTSCKTRTSSGITAKQADAIEARLDSMTVREKVGQLFCVRPEALDVALEWDTDEKLASFKLQSVNERMLRVNREYPVGGIILFAHNIEDEAQINTFQSSLKALNGEPLLYIDEEGGRVARIANNPNFKVQKFSSMANVAKKGDIKDAFNCGLTIGKYLKHYGFNVDLAPVADVNTNPQNPVIGTRAFSGDPAVAAKMVTAYMKGLEEEGIISCLKHFPGHGDTKTDSHFGYAQTLKTWEEIDACEMVTFKAGIRAGAPMIMTAHIAAPKVTGSDIPSTLSPVILTEKLRGELGFQGVIITDAMAMGAITKQYNSADAAVLAIIAGADIVLCPKDFREAFDGVVKAVEDGIISAERLDESVRRVLVLKARYQN